MSNVKTGRISQRREWAIMDRPPAPSVENLRSNFPGWNVVRANLKLASSGKKPESSEKPAVTSPASQTTDHVKVEAPESVRPELSSEAETQAQNDPFDTAQTVRAAMPSAATAVTVAGASLASAALTESTVFDESADEAVQLQPSWFAEPPKASVPQSAIEENYLDQIDQFDEPMNAGLELQDTAYGAVEEFGAVQDDFAEFADAPVNGPLDQSMRDELDSISHMVDQALEENSQSASDAEDASLEVGGDPFSSDLDHMLDDFDDDRALGTGVSHDRAMPEERVYQPASAQDDTFDLNLDDMLIEPEPNTGSGQMASGNAFRGAHPVDDIDDIFDLDDPLEAPPPLNSGSQYSMGHPGGQQIPASPDQPVDDEFRRMIEQDQHTTHQSPMQSRQFMDEPIGSDDHEPEWSSGWDDDHDSLEEAVPEKGSRINLRGLIDKAYSLAVRKDGKSASKNTGSEDPFDDDF